MKNKKNSFKIIATKTNKETRVYFSSRLIHLLIKFKWRNFLFDDSGMRNIKRKL